MLSRNDRPNRPYKNFEDCRLKSCSSLPDDKKLDTTFYPCSKCDGYGWFRLESDYDFMEGWKCAPRYKCDVCKQTGRGSKSNLVVKYREAMASYRKRISEWKAMDSLRRSGLRKLTKAERTALGVG